MPAFGLSEIHLKEWETTRERELRDGPGIPQLEQSLREKDDIIQSQYAEIMGLRNSLEKAITLLNEATKAGVP